MNSELLKAALQDAYNDDFSGFDSAPEFRASLSHRIRMRRILSKFYGAPLPETKPKFNRRLAAVLLIIILTAAGAGKPQIEEIYCIPSLPDGFELTDEITPEMTGGMIYDLTYNRGDELISFTQCIKSKYNSHLDNEHGDLEEITVGGHTGLYLGGYGSVCIIVWDDGNYILEFATTLPRDEAFALAESVKPAQNADG